MGTSFCRRLPFTLATVVGVVSCVAALGCTSISIDQFAEELTASICEREARCCSASERLFSTEEECTMLQIAAAEELEALLRASEEAGRLGYDADLAFECFEAERKRSCIDTEESAVCATIFTGLVADGELCTNDYDCSEACRPDGAGALRCASFGQAGDLCRTDEHCAPHHYCDFIDGVCVQALLLDASCDWTTFCDEGLFCDLTLAAPVCAGLAPICTGGA